MPKIAEHLYAKSLDELKKEQDSSWPRPILLRTLKGYNVRDFQADLIAGVIVGIVALPLSIALAIAVGAKPEVGLYTAIVGGGVAALFGGSHSQVTGPTAAFIVILSPILAQQGLSGLMAAGLMAGVILVIMGLGGFGSMIRYVPYPVTTGFTSGIAVTIATIQLKDILGLKDELGRDLKLPDHFHEKVETLYHGLRTTPSDVMLHTGIVGGLTLAILIFYPRFLPSLARKIPATLVGVLAAVAATFLLGRFCNWRDIATIGSRFGGIPRGLPSFNTALFTDFSWSYDNLKPLFLPAVAIAMLGSIESLLSAVVADGMSGKKHDPNSELVGQGLANIVSPLFGGFAATGAIARTTVNIKNGGRSPISSFVHACTLLLIMLVAAPYASFIPMAALGAILLVVAYNMAELKHFRHLLRAPKSDMLILFACFLLTVFTDMVVAVIVGMVLASLLFMRRMSELTRVDALTSVAGDKEMQSHALEVHDIPRGVVIYSVDGPFFFGACEKAITAMETSGGDASIFILRLNRVPAIDATGLYALEKIYEHLNRRGNTLILSKVRPQPRYVMAKAGFIQKLDPANIVPDVEWALARAYEVLGPDAQKRRSGKTGRTVAPQDSRV